MVVKFPPCPDILRPIQPYLKIADEHDEKEPIVSYWCRLYSLQTAMTIDKKSDQAKALLLNLMDWLEKTKRAPNVSECISSEIAAQAYMENYALKLFVWADNMDRAGQFNKNVYKSFYASGVLMDVITVFGELNEELVNNRKYAKWKATYIFNCLKSGETPVPGPMNNNPENDISTSYANPTSEEEKELDALLNLNNKGQSSNFPTPSDVNSNSGNIFGPSVPSELHMPPGNTNYSNPHPTPATEEPPTAGPVTASGIEIGVTQVAKAQKYCKFASSALNYNDIAEAVNNLQKALYLLQNGKEN